MSLKKTLFIKDLEEGQNVDTPFLVVSQSRGRTNRGAVYLNVELGDNSGRVHAKVWDGAEQLSAYLKEGCVAVVNAYVDSYRGSLQLVIRRVDAVNEDEINWADFLKASLKSELEMKRDLWDLINSVEDHDFRRLLCAVLAHPEVIDTFFIMPAAKNMHHAYLHGLLEHSLSVGVLARLIASHYPTLNSSLLISGAILHDLGKIWEFKKPPQNDYSTIGRLKGHLVMGCEFLGKIYEELENFPKVKLELLQHLILSHHGEPEFGAPVRPQLLEALVLHHIDNIDAKFEAINSFLEKDSNEDGWSPYHRLLGTYYYKTPQLDYASDEPLEPEKPIIQAESDDNGEITASEIDAEDLDFKGRLF